MNTTPAGWYHGTGDPEGTERWWDGQQWVGNPRPIGGGMGVPGQPATTLGGAAPTTPHAGTFGREPGGTWRRIFAYLIDGIIAGILNAPAAINMFSTLKFDEFAAGKQTELKVNFGLMLLGAILNIAYMVVPVALWGATAGKAILGLRVIRASDGVTPPGFGPAALRHAPFIAVQLIGILLLNSSQSSARSFNNISTLLSIATLVMVISDKDRRRSLSDRVGKTYVVRTS